MAQWPTNHKPKGIIPLPHILISFKVRCKAGGGRGGAGGWGGLAKQCCFVSKILYIGLPVWGLQHKKYDAKELQAGPEEVEDISSR